MKYSPELSVFVLYFPFLLLYTKCPYISCGNTWPVANRSEGVPERDMISLRMMGWGLAAGKNSSAAAATAAAVVAVTILEKGYFFEDVSKKYPPRSTILEKG